MHYLLPRDAMEFGKYRRSLSGVPRQGCLLCRRLFDLQLSGHTHKGRIFPFTPLTRVMFPLNAGEYDLGKGSRLHVSRGTGTWGPPIRFLAPPEVTVIELVRKGV